MMVSSLFRASGGHRGCACQGVISEKINTKNCYIETELGGGKRAEELVLTISIVRHISILRAPKFGGSEILTCRTPTAKSWGEYHGTVKWYSPEALRDKVV
jgi:hypothetical protein